MHVNERPTEDAYKQLQRAYDFFNQALFNEELPECLITFHRNPRSMGYFSPARFSSKVGEKSDEIAMNIAYFAVQPIEEVMSTLVHEQVHLYMYHFGEDSKMGYHNKAWAMKMREVGLIASSTGLPGGKEVGERMSHYIEPGGRFETACRQLIREIPEFAWFDRYVAQRPETSRQQIAMLDEAGVHIEVSMLPSDKFDGLELCIPGGRMPKDLSKKKKKKDLPGESVGDGGRKDKYEVGGADGVAGGPDLSNGQGSEEDVDDVELVGSKKSTRTKYRCEGCKSAVWGKPKLSLICGTCRTAYREM